MSVPVAASRWALVACVEADGWHGSVRDTWQTDEVTDDAITAVAAVYEDGTALRVVAPDGPRPLLVVVGGRACPLALPDDVRRYLGAEACAAWAADPVAWWQTHADGRHLLRVAGAAVRAQGSPLHRHVVKAACACARDALPAWAARYPNDDRPRLAVETAERWADGDATLTEVRAAAAAAWAARAAAAWAARAAAGAAWAASLARSAYHARRLVPLREVLVGLVGGAS